MINDRHIALWQFYNRIISSVSLTAILDNKSQRLAKNFEHWNNGRFAQNQQRPVEFRIGSTGVFYRNKAWAVMKMALNIHSDIQSMSQPAVMAVTNHALAMTVAYKAILAMAMTYSCVLTVYIAWCTHLPPSHALRWFRTGQRIYSFLFFFDCRCFEHAALDFIVIDVLTSMPED